jgi:dedicator of cytokinesis protein 3
MLAFHETLETFFRKNFEEEMLRLSFDVPTERGVVAPSSLHPPDVPSYASSLADAISINQSSSSATRAPFAIPSPPVPALHITPPQSPSTSFAGLQQPTRLQKHIAHLTRHGMNAVASGPGEGIDGYHHRTDSLSLGSPQGSFVNVTGTAGPSVANAGSASIAGSKSVGSLKGRFSRLGSLSFGRRDGNAP